MRRTLTVFLATAMVGLLASTPSSAQSSPLRWVPCKEAPDDPALRCATLAVPVDWNRPHGPKIELGVARRTATDPKARIGSMLINPGGPGGSGREFAIFDAGFFSDDVRRHFDLVGFDPRGVGRSNAVRCSRELAEQAPHFLMTSQREFEQRSRIWTRSWPRLVTGS